jgi:hypothetical protein
MIYANVNNAFNAVVSNDTETLGQIFTTLYPPPANSDIYNLTVGHTTITWNTSTVFDPTFLPTLLSNVTEQQFAVLLFDAFEKIFESYNLELPDNYTHILDDIANGAPLTNATLINLGNMLDARFLVSAVYFLVACVCLSNTRLIQGSLLIFSTGILLIQKWPRDRFSWYRIYGRLLFGMAFVGLIGIWDSADDPGDSSGADWLDSGWMMPTFVLVLAVISNNPPNSLLTEVIGEFMLNLRAMWHYRRAGKLPPRGSVYNRWAKKIDRLLR